MSLAMRLRAYAPNGASLGLLPTPQTVSASMVYGDAGGMEVAYPPAGPKSSLLASPCEIAVEVSYDDGASWTEPNDARYLRLVRKGDTVEQVPVVTYSGPSYVWRFSKAKVLPNGLLNADGKRPFLSATPGTILRTLIQEAQARGALAGIDASSFSTTKDSAGANWAQVITLYYEPGLDYLTILLNLQAQGLIDFTMAGRSLLVYNGDTVMAGASGALLRKGRDLTEAPYTGTLEGLANYVYLLGDEGASTERTNATATAPWGRWESFISQGGVKDSGTMTVLTDSSLELSAAERVENTYGLVFAAAKSLPFRDYGLGKTVGVADGTAVPTQLRVRQITLTRDEKGVVAGNVVLNDRFLENEVRQTRRVNGITGGATADGGTGARPAPVGVDRMAPKDTTVGSFTTSAYLDAEGKVWALATVNVNPVTTNADGTALDDLQGYEVMYRRSGDTTWSAPIQDDDGVAVAVSGLFPGTVYQFVARAYDTSGNRATLSPVVALTTASDASAPGRPSQPSLTPYLGQLLVSYDGKVDTDGNGSGDAPAPLDAVYCEVWSTPWSTDPTDPTNTLIDRLPAKGGSTVMTGLSYGATYRVWTRLVDRAGNVSPWSVLSYNVPVKAAPGDIDSITANQITAGAMSAAITISGRIATSLTGARVEINSTGLRAYDSAGLQTVGIGTDGSATFAGVFKTTAANGRTLEISTAALNNSWGEDGQHSIKWTPATLSANWTAAGILPLALTSGSNYGSGLLLQGSTQMVAPYAGSIVYLGMDSLFLRGIGATGKSSSVSMYEASGTSYLDLGTDVTGTVTVGNGGAGVSTNVNGGGQVRLFSSGGVVDLVDRDSWLGVRLTKDATSTFFQSQTIYNRTYTGTANLLITASGVIGRISSLEATKVAVDRSWADSVALERIKGLTPASYYDRWNAERYAALVAEPDAEAVDAEYPQRLLGLIAEDVQELGLDELLTHDDQGALAGVAYDRLAVALIPWLRDLEARLVALEPAQTPVNSPA